MTRSPLLSTLALTSSLACSTVAEQTPTTTGSQSGTTDNAGQSDTSASPTSGGGESTPVSGPGTGTTEASTATPDATTTEPDPSSTSQPFIAGLDMGEGNECDTYAQDCPRGQKCTVYANDGGIAWNATKCVEVVPDPAKVGEPCTAVESGVSGLDDCELGSMCWDVDDELKGTCVALCGGSPEAPTCPEGSTCTFGRVLSLCFADCDPIAQDCPETDELCIPTANSFACTADLDDPEDVDGQQHAPCDFAQQCDKGLACLASQSAEECDPQASGCCQPFCPVSQGDAQCTGAGQVCMPWFAEGQAPPGYEDVGACALPP